jgi:hypothetical protein
LSLLLRSSFSCHRSGCVAACATLFCYSARGGFTSFSRTASSAFHYFARLRSRCRLRPIYLFFSLRQIGWPCVVRSVKLRCLQNRQSHAKACFAGCPLLHSQAARKLGQSPQSVRSSLIAAIAQPFGSRLFFLF